MFSLQCIAWLSVVLVQAIFYFKPQRERRSVSDAISRTPEGEHDSNADGKNSSLPSTTKGPKAGTRITGRILLDDDGYCDSASEKSRTMDQEREKSLHNSHVMSEPSSQESKHFDDNASVEDDEEWRYQLLKSYYEDHNFQIPSSINKYQCGMRELPHVTPTVVSFQQ